jgi:hypothetical protein
MAIDLSYLRHREQVERKRAIWGNDAESRAAHGSLADRYAIRIRELREAESGEEQREGTLAPDPEPCR